MKQTILLFTLMFSSLFISCSDDDDGVDDPVVGTWQLEQTFTNDVSENISDCAKEEIIEFLGSLDFNGAPHEEVEENGETVCRRTGDTFGKWKNLGDNQYEITFGGSLEGQVQVIEIIVEGDTLTTRSTFTENGEVSTFRQEFKRI